MSLIYESLADFAGSTSGILYVTTYNTTTHIWHTKQVSLTGAGAGANAGADPVYVTQIYGQLGGSGSPELLAYEGFVFLQAHSGGTTIKARFDLFIYDASSDNSVQLDVVPFAQEPSNTPGLTPWASPSTTEMFISTASTNLALQGAFMKLQRNQERSRVQASRH